MPIHPANATELATIAREVGADTLADIMGSDRMDELAGYDVSFWRDAAWRLRGFAEEEEAGSRRESRKAVGCSNPSRRS